MTKQIRILIIDDDADIGTMLKMMMEYKGYSVTLLNKADKIFECLDTNTIDLIMLDMLIGGINGIDVCKNIRQTALVSHLPILMISALPDARQVCIEAGANNFISKPFEMEDILSIVKALTNNVSES